MYGCICVCLCALYPFIAPIQAHHRVCPKSANPQFKNNGKSMHMPYVLDKKSFREKYKDQIDMPRDNAGKCCIRVVGFVALYKEKSKEN